MRASDVVDSGEARSGAPIIGVTTYSQRARFDVWDTESVVLHRLYVDALRRAGAIPLLLPPVATGADEMLAAVHGLVLAGGPDVDPTRYGAQTHPATGEPSGLRDEFEFEALRAALRRDIPVLGVCRGLQVLNIELGGTLQQHVGVEGGVAHQAAADESGVHEVAFAERSRLIRVLGLRTKVRCHHHQAVERAADGLRPVAHAADGVIEALEHEERAFVVGVQWHPEAQDERDDRLFEALVAACR